MNGCEIRFDIPPAPDEIRAMRLKHSLTAFDAARLVHVTPNTWGRWESGTRQMHSAYWELFAFKLGEHP